MYTTLILSLVCVVVLIAVIDSTKINDGVSMNLSQKFLICCNVDSYTTISQCVESSYDYNNRNKKALFEFCSNENQQNQNIIVTNVLAHAENKRNNTSQWCLSSKDMGFQLLPCNENVNKQATIDTANVINLRVQHKCCPWNYIYSASEQQCVKQSSKNILVNDVDAYMTGGALVCGGSQVQVEYYDVGVEQLDFAKNSLWFKNKRYALKEYCVEMISNTKRFLLRTCEQMSICTRITCLRRCCGVGQRYNKLNRTTCVPEFEEHEFESFASLEFSATFVKPLAFGLIDGLECQKYILQTNEAVTISERNAVLMLNTSQRNYGYNQYCVERMGNATWVEEKLVTFLCFERDPIKMDTLRFRIYPTGLIISCCFYLLTLLVYLILPKLRNLPGKILICLVINLLAAYFSIAIGQLMPTTNDVICYLSAFFIYFCLIAAFAWMNILSFDIWRTFGSTKHRNEIKGRENKQIMLYSIYGWGLPIVLTSNIILITRTEIINENLRPQFGNGKCWFNYESSAAASLLFFSGPLGVLSIINLVLFCLTLQYCNKVKREINRMQSLNMDKSALNKRFTLDKTRFAMNTKLFIVMGITWLLELLSIIFYDHNNIMFWAISDSFNILLGVFIFFIYVFKRRVWLLLLEKFGYGSATTQNYTNTTNYQRGSTSFLKETSVRLTPI